MSSDRFKKKNIFNYVYEYAFFYVTKPQGAVFAPEPGFYIY